MQNTENSAGENGKPGRSILSCMLLDFGVRLYCKNISENRKNAFKRHSRIMSCTPLVPVWHTETNGVF